jgi:hypothetical protein
MIMGMINGDNWGRSYFVVRGEILGFTNDELVRNHLARMLYYVLVSTATMWVYSSVVEQSTADR